MVKKSGQRKLYEKSIKNWPEDDRPREKLLKNGAKALSNSELLAILYVPDAWIDTKSTKIGYEVSFTRYFYKPQQLRSLEEIRVDIEKIEKESDGLLRSILDIS